MRNIRWRPLLIVALRLVIALGFAAPIASKLAARERWAHQFVLWGYPAWGADATTGLEIAGLIALWIPTLAKAAIAILTVILIGAACTWLIHGPGILAVVPGTVLAFVAGLAWLEVTVRLPGVRPNEPSYNSAAPGSATSSQVAQGKEEGKAGRLTPRTDRDAH
jgi:hypothetical protein